MTDQKKINEGYIKKGGINPKPTTQRPAPPPAQSPSSPSTTQQSNSSN